MKKISVMVAGVFLSVVLGCSTTPPSATAPQYQPRDVPKLKVVVECAGCQVREDIPQLIVEGYTDAAADAGVKVLPESEATLAIKEYSARNSAARLMLGVFSGKDEIKAVVTFQNRAFVVEDYFRNAVSDIDNLARKIGGMAFEKLSQ